MPRFRLPPGIYFNLMGYVTGNNGQFKNLVRFIGNFIK
jgi:hypothetical protein